MAVRNLYPNLPGHLVEFKDGGLQVASNEIVNGYDKSLLILGTALDGPINEPVKISPTTVTQVFGSEVNERGYPNGATLTKYAKQAFKNGFSDVRCMRVTGTQAMAEIVKSSESEVEVVDGKPLSVKIGGTESKAKLDLNFLPVTDAPKVGNATQPRMNLSEILGDSESIISLGSSSNPSVTYGDYEGHLEIPAIALSKNPTVKAVYYYKQVSDGNGIVNDVAPGSKFSDLPDYHVVNVNASTGAVTIDKQIDNPITDIREAGDTGAFRTHVVPVFDTDGVVKVYELNCSADSTADDAVCLYTTPYTNLGNGNFSIQDGSGKLPITDRGVSVVVYLVNDDGTETKLDIDVDYTVNGNQLNLINTAAYLPDDQIRVEYYTYQRKRAEETFENLNSSDGPDSVTITPIPVDNKVTVKHGNDEVDPSGSTFNSGYTVKVDTVNDTLTVEFPAGNYQRDYEMTVEYEVNNVISEREAFTFVSIYGGKVYNGASVSITEETRDGEVGRRFTFTKPDSKLYGTGDKPFYFTSFDCVTVGELKIALGRYALNNVFDIVTDNEDITLADVPVGVAVLDGGSDGLNPTNNEMYEALSGKRDADGYLLERGSYQILENYHCDYIYVAGVYGDSTQTVSKISSFQHELALLCAVLTYRTKMTHGFMDVKPNSNTTLVGIQKFVDRLANMSNLHYMVDSDGNDIVDADGNKMDIGWYTSLVVGPDPVMVSDKLGTYYGSAAIAYAALCASIKPQSAPTNKALPGVKGMKYRLSNKQMDTLTGNRMVCFRLKNEGVTTASSVPYCVDGVTCGAPNCDYSRMSTVKTVTDVIDQVREVCDPFIGEPNTVEQRNAMSALISKRLSYLMEQGEIQSYEFEINATIEQVLIGECTIALTLVPAMELRRITTVVSLRAAA